MEGRRRGRERGLTTAAMVEDKYPHKIHDESTNRYDHQSIMFHLWRLKSSLGKVQDGLLDVTHTSRDNGGSLLTSIASENMKKAINRRKRALTNPATISALTYLHTTHDMYMLSLETCSRAVALIPV